MDIQRYLIFAVSMAAIIILTRLGGNWLSRRASRKPLNEKASNIIRQPKIYLYVGIAGTIFCIAFCIALAFAIIFMPAIIFADPEHEINWLRTALQGLLLIMLSIYILLLAANWRVEIGENEFNFRNIWGRKRTYQYDEVEVKLFSASARFYHKGKYIVGISPMQENWTALQNVITAHKRKVREEQRLIAKEEKEKAKEEKAREKTRSMAEKERREEQKKSD